MTPSTRSAKKFLIGQILIEADRENVPLSELERRMLEFSEIEETPSDFAELNTKFESEYDTAEYEDKIASLIRNRVDGLTAIHSPQLDRWNEAVSTLASGDHYLLVLIDQAQPRPLSKLLAKIGIAPPGSNKPPYDGLKLLTTAVIVVILMLALGALFQRLGIFVQYR